MGLGAWQMQNGLKTFSQVLKASNFKRNNSPCTCIELRKVKFVLDLSWFCLFVFGKLVSKCIWPKLIEVGWVNASKTSLENKERSYKCYAIWFFRTLSHFLSPHMTTLGPDPRIWERYLIIWGPYLIALGLNPTIFGPDLTSYHIRTLNVTTI